MSFDNYTGGLVLTLSGRTGNHFQQFLNALQYAADHPEKNIDGIILNYPSPLFGDRLFIPFKQIEEGTMIVPVYARKNVDFFRKYENASQTRETWQRVFRPFIPWRIPVEEVAEPADVVIHVRSGDLFFPGGSHPAYLQPGLDYQQKIVSRLFAENSSRKFLIVCEDHKNPVIDALESWALKEGVSMKVQSSPQELLADLAAIAAAREAVVFGYGTFWKNLQQLAEKLPSVWYFPDYFAEGRLDVLREDPAVRLEVVSTGSQAADMGAWRNTPEQRERMVCGMSLSPEEGACVP